MSKKDWQKNRQRQVQRGNTALAAHQQKGKRLSPPLMTIPGMSFVNWERDDLPDYLLISAYLVDEPVTDVHRLHHLLNIIDQATEKLREAVPAGQADDASRADTGEPLTEAVPTDDAVTGGVEQKTPPGVLTGRLTEFETFSTQERIAVLAALRNRGLYQDLVPEPVFHTLGMYPHAPGSWLLQPWRDRGVSVDPGIAERTLGHILIEGGPHQGPLATRTKALACNRWGAAGRMSVPPDLAKEFNGWPYPEDQEDENRKVEASYRAMFGALGSLPGTDLDPVAVWARQFWRANWRIYACRWPTPPELLQRRGDSEETDDTSGSKEVKDFSPGEPDSDTDAAFEEQVAADRELSEDGDGAAHVIYWRRALDDARATVDAIQEEFQKLAERTDPDLYNPDRYDVLTGLVSRTLRYLSVFAGYPPLWTMEHGAPLLRALIEARIVLRFLIRRDDSDLYSKFKAYGMGKLKLLKLHLEKLLDEQNDPPADLIEYVEYLDALVNQDVMEEFQVIDVGGNFAGVDTRRMATEADLDQEYRLVFAPASSNVHGEWSIIDEYVFVRCQNPAHRRHRILGRDRDHRAGSMFVQSLYMHAELLVDDYRDATESQRKLA